MKINYIKSFIALAVSGLIAYGFHSFYSFENKELLTIGSFLFFSITLLFSIGIILSLPRATTLIKTISIVFFIIALVSNLIFSFTDFNKSIYIIINGILFLIYLLIAYSIKKLTNNLGRFGLEPHHWLYSNACPDSPLKIIDW